MVNTRTTAKALRAPTVMTTGIVKPEVNAEDRRMDLTAAPAVPLVAPPCLQRSYISQFSPFESSESSEAEKGAYQKNSDREDAARSNETGKGADTPVAGTHAVNVQAAGSITTPPAAEQALIAETVEQHAATPTPPLPSQTIPATSHRLSIASILNPLPPAAITPSGSQPLLDPVVQVGSSDLGEKDAPVVGAPVANAPKSGHKKSSLPSTSFNPDTLFTEKTSSTNFHSSRDAEKSANVTEHPDYEDALRLLSTRMSLLREHNNLKNGAKAESRKRGVSLVTAGASQAKKAPPAAESCEPTRQSARINEQKAREGAKGEAAGSAVANKENGCSPKTRRFITLAMTVADAPRLPLSLRSAPQEEANDDGTDNDESVAVLKEAEEKKLKLKKSVHARATKIPETETKSKVEAPGARSKAPKIAAKAPKAKRTRPGQEGAGPNEAPKPKRARK